MLKFRKRREDLMECLGEGTLILPGATLATRNSDVTYPFRQNSDFFYLTGFEEPGACLILKKTETQLQSTLLVPPRDKVKEIWNGKRAGIEGAVLEFGLDVAGSKEEIDSVLKAALEGESTLFYEFSRSKELDQKLISILGQFQTVNRKNPVFPQTLKFFARALAGLRQIKSPSEVESLQKAVSITREANSKVLELLRPGVNEAEIQAALEFEYGRHGYTAGYGSIVAGGANATVLHYTQNNAPLLPETLLLIDSGCEVDYYSADVTRCYPVDGRFSKRAREIYSIVLKANSQAIDCCIPGSNIEKVHAEAKKVLGEGLKELGLSTALEQFYMHKTSHWLGMDVHDSGLYEASGVPVPFKKGMVLTVEPGLYFNPNYSGVETIYDGIGVRIEDDILITEGSPEVLTATIPKGMDEIEALMAKTVNID
jgi:Xaa-Pro aminopeptidase